VLVAQIGIGGGRMENLFHKYATSLSAVISSQTWVEVENLAKAMYDAWENNRQLFLCGNGGSAGNAIHLANDFLYGIASQTPRPGMKVEALSANSAVLTCLGNDVGYSEIYAEQLLAKANSGDLHVVNFEIDRKLSQLTTATTRITKYGKRLHINRITDL
jgi:D-sedoheptulose 7-phosphate isomerase